VRNLFIYDQLLKRWDQTVEITQIHIHIHIHNNTMAGTTRGRFRRATCPCGELEAPGVLSPVFPGERGVFELIYGRLVI
jgi:hypothetical protein